MPMAQGSFQSTIDEANVNYDIAAGHDHDGSNSKAIVGFVPVGTVIDWLKSFTNTPALPAQFVECNGQTLSDSDSVYNGQVIPNLNGDNRFMRGNSTSGGVGGNESVTLTDNELPAHIHSISNRQNTNVDHQHGTPFVAGEPVGVSGTSSANTDSTGSGNSFDIKPKFYNTVKILRIK